MSMMSDLHVEKAYGIPTTVEDMYNRNMDALAGIINAEPMTEDNFVSPEEDEANQAFYKDIDKLTDEEVAEKAINM